MREVNISATKNIFNTLLRVFENTELEIYDSTFEKNFGLSKGSVLCGDYKSTTSRIFNTSFIENAAAEGGVFCAKDGSKIECNECSIISNFGVNGGVFVANTNGYFKFNNSTLETNKAISVAIGEIIDSASVS